MELKRELIRGAGPVAVLQLLKRREMYGYELAEALSQRSDGVLRPREGHAAVAADASECRSQAGDAISLGRLIDRSARVGTNRKPDQPGGGGRTWTGRRA